jgi:hypothetical protein
MKRRNYFIVIALLFITQLTLAQTSIQKAEDEASEYSIDLHQINTRSQLLLNSRFAVFFQNGHELEEIYSIASVSGLHITYAHIIDGIPVFNSVLKLHYTPESDLFIVQDKLTRLQVNRNSASQVSNSNPIWISTGGELLLGNIGTGGTLVNPTQYTELHGHKIDEDFKKLYLKAPDTTVKAKVFMVNPLNTAGVDYGGKYIDNKDSNSMELEAQLVEVEMKVLFENGNFVLGDSRFRFKNVIDPATPQVTSKTDSFFYNRSDIEFEDVNAFYHLSNYAKYLTDIGYQSLLYDSLIVDATAGTADASAFDPTPNPKTLEFGLGNVDDAEDGEVIIHELGHALSTKASPFTVKGNDRQAMEEGNCDYLASSYSMLFTSYKDWKVFSWDGHNEFWSGFVNNSYKNYKTDRTGFRDNDREIWSSALICLREKLGQAVVDSLVLEHLFYQVKNATMPEMANVLLRIDTLQNQGENNWAIRTCFVDHGILEPAAISPIQVDKQIQLKNSFNFALGTGCLELVSTGGKFYKVELYNLSGVLIHESKAPNNYWTLSPAGIAPGTYLLKIIGETRSYQSKLLRF